MKHAVINLLKPPGMTSHDAVSFVRRIYGQKRVGHAGTLDPAAAGVLPVFLGNATRLVEYAEAFDKTYRTEIMFGISTRTGDDTGEVVDRQEVNLPPLQELRRVAESFRGAQEQVPPMYSALKVNGVKLYDLARAGKEIERASRQIEITDINILNSDRNSLVMQLRCSKGTYVRVLCEDFGKRLGLPAMMSTLLRIAVGPFELSSAATLEEIESAPLLALQPPDVAVQHLPPVFLAELDVIRLKQGQIITRQVDDESSGDEVIVRLHDEEKSLFGIGRLYLNSGRLQPIKILRDGLN